MTAPTEAPYKCRDCGTGATRDIDGVFHGVIDVDPCPRGDDDFHHWEPTLAVMPSTCKVPSHDHDAIISPDGSSNPTTNLCNGCGVPTHYENLVEWYQHDSTADPDCFLAETLDDAVPCSERPKECAECGAYLTNGELVRLDAGETVEHGAPVHQVRAVEQVPA